MLELIRIGHVYEKLCMEEGLQPLQWAKAEKKGSFLIFRSSTGSEVLQYSCGKKKIIRFRGRYCREWVTV